MKSRVLVIVGVVFVLVGSGMSDSTTWLVIGAVVVVAGLALAVLGARRRS